jgi:uroporphyrinogen-III decarboxylase
MVSNEEKERVWRAYRDGRPVRVPVTYGVNPRVVLFDPAWNKRGVTFAEYYADPAAAVEIQLQFMEYQSQYLNNYRDQPLGRPEEWAFYVDNQNTYDSAYFGGELAFRDGQVADVVPPLAGAGKETIFQMDIDHPLENPFIKDCLRRWEGMKAAGRLSYHGMRFKVNPPLMGFDGHFTIAVNLRGHELLTDIYEDRPYVQRLMEFIHRGVIIRNRALAERFGKKAFDGASGSFADDSIQLISAETYTELVLPLHRAWYALWSQAGPHSIHLCGDATRLFPLIRRELNVNSFDTGFPVDHGPLRDALGEDVEIAGGPEVSLLLGGTGEQVFERTRAILTSGVMRGGRFILREANNLPPRCPEENLSAMYRCCLEHGRY